jgi:hypothetical protein
MSLPADSREDPSDILSEKKRIREEKLTSARTWSNVEIGAKNMIALTGKSETGESMQELNKAKRTIIEEWGPCVSLIPGPSNVVYLFQVSRGAAGICFKAYLPGHTPELCGLESKCVFDDAGRL